MLSSPDYPICFYFYFVGTEWPVLCSSSSSSCWCAVKNLLSLTQNFRHWSAEASSERLLQGSAKRVHTEPSDWSAAKKIDRGYQEKMLNIVGSNHMCYTSSLFYCISNENWAKHMHHCQIQCNFGGTDDLCKLGKEYLTAVTCKFRISF